MILAPSCTEALAGYSRVRIGAMARALEAQCVTVMASTVGDAAWSPAVDTNTGAGGVFGPPDTGFPPTGVIAEGMLDHPGWTVAEVEPAAWRMCAPMASCSTVATGTIRQGVMPRSHPNARDD